MLVGHENGQHGLGRRGLHPTMPVNHRRPEGSRRQSAQRQQTIAQHWAEFNKHQCAESGCGVSSDGCGLTRRKVERVSSPPIVAATARVAAAIGVAVIVAVSVTAGLRCRLDEAC